MTDAELAGCLFSQPPLQHGHGSKNQVLTLTLDFELESWNMKKQGLTISAVVALMAAASDFLIHHCHLRITMMTENPVMHWMRSERRLIWARKYFTRTQRTPSGWASTYPYTWQLLRTCGEQRGPLLVETHHTHSIEQQCLPGTGSKNPRTLLTPLCLPPWAGLILGLQSLPLDKDCL